MALFAHVEDAVDVTIETQDLLVPGFDPLLLNLFLDQLLANVHHQVEEESSTHYEADSQDPQLPRHMNDDHSRYLKQVYFRIAMRNDTCWSEEKAYYYLWP